MELDNIGDVIRGAMAYERSRAEAASYNMAMANVALNPGEVSPLLRVVPPSAFAGRLGVALPQTEPQLGGDVRLVHEPTHPMADAEGMVHYPRVEMATEMATLVTATRAYEANIRAYNSLRAMNLKALDIGK